MSGAGSDGLFEVEIEPRNDSYDPDDVGWLDQMATLYADLGAQVDTVRGGRPVEGAKGAVEQLIVSLGSAGVFGAVVDCLRAWLGRDRDRRIDLRCGGARRKILLAAAAAAAVVGGVVAAILLLSSGSGGSSPASGSFHASDHSVTAKAPWRLKIVDHIQPYSSDNGCNITLTDTHSGTKIPLPIGQYHTSILQVHQTGSFRWQVNDPAGCTVKPLPTSGTVKLPFPFDQVGYGDSNAFVAPKVVAVRLTGHRNGNCKIALYNPASGQPLGPVKLGKGTVTFDTHGSPTAYLQFHSCHALVSPAQ